MPRAGLYIDFQKARQAEIAWNQAFLQGLDDSPRGSKRMGINHSRSSGVKRMRENSYLLSLVTIRKPG